MSTRAWIESTVTLPVEPISRVTRVVEEYRVWLWSDHRGNWVALHEDPRPRAADGARPIALWGVYPTREEALRAVWEGEQQLRAAGRDRRKTDRRRHPRLYPDRRSGADGRLFTSLD